MFLSNFSLYNLRFSYLPTIFCKCVFIALSPITSSLDVTRVNQIVSYRVVAVVAGNSETVTLSGLKADTQYQLTVAAVWNGKKYRSRPIVFRTLGKY